uniref:Uncharacterized protein n=1 Tax=Arundo donax TaxID=35708 RepID=A0A0A9HG20_ARUDO
MASMFYKASQFQTAPKGKHFIADKNTNENREYMLNSPTFKSLVATHCSLFKEKSSFL